MKNIITYMCFLAVSCLVSNQASADESAYICQNSDKYVIRDYKINDILSGYNAGSSIDINFCNNEKVSIKVESLVSDKYEKRYFSDPILTIDRKFLVSSVQNFCCASYLTTEYLLSYNNRKQAYIYPSYGQVWSWKFSQNEKSIIMESGFSHGMQEPNIDEYDIKTGKKTKHLKDGK